MDFFPEIKVNGAEAEAIARGLYSVARVDGMHEREAALITQFYQEITQGSMSANFAELEHAADVDVPYLAAQLQDPGLRRMFVKTAFLLAYADGQVSAEERDRIGALATGLGIDAAAAAEIEEEVKEFLLMQLSGISNVESVRKVAKKLGI